jgi:hypothetical protein
MRSTREHTETGVVREIRGPEGGARFGAAYLVTCRGNLFDLSGMRDYASSNQVTVEATLACAKTMAERSKWKDSATS